MTAGAAKARICRCCTARVATAGSAEKPACNNAILMASAYANRSQKQGKTKFMVVPTDARAWRQVSPLSW